MQKLKWHTEQRIINDLIPYEQNPRTITEKQKNDLEKSLKKFNLMSIPVINTDNTIIFHSKNNDIERGHLLLGLIIKLKNKYWEL